MDLVCDMRGVVVGTEVRTNGVRNFLQLMGGNGDESEEQRERLWGDCILSWVAWFHVERIA